MKNKIEQLLNNEPKISTIEIAKKLDTSEYEVLQNINHDIAKAVDSSNFDEIIQDISTWGKVLMLKVTNSFVIEIKDNMPTGSYGHGYYNFDSKQSSISGHLKVSDIDKIIFETKKHRGMTSYLIGFYDKQGDNIFKIYVGRDENRELKKDQLEKYFNLKNKL